MSQYWSRPAVRAVTLKKQSKLTRRYSISVAPRADHLASVSQPSKSCCQRGALYCKAGVEFNAKNKIAGGIVMASSIARYAPEAAVPTYSALKASLVGLVRSLRNNVVFDGITINAVAPSATYTPLAAGWLGPLVAAGLLTVSQPELPAPALIYTATQNRRVETYGKKRVDDMYNKKRWNGRIIYVLGDKFTELEEPTAGLRLYWLGERQASQISIGGDGCTPGNSL